MRFCNLVVYCKYSEENPKHVWWSQSYWVVFLGGLGGLPTDGTLLCVLVRWKAAGGIADVLYFRGFISKTEFSSMSYGTCRVMFSRWVSLSSPWDGVQPVGGKPSERCETDVVYAVFCAVCVAVTAASNIVDDDEMNCSDVLFLRQRLFLVYQRLSCPFWLIGRATCILMIWTHRVRCNTGCDTLQGKHIHTNVPVLSLSKSPLPKLPLFKSYFYLFFFVLFCVVK